MFKNRTLKLETGENTGKVGELCWPDDVGIISNIISRAEV